MFTISLLDFRQTKYISATSVIKYNWLFLFFVKTTHEHSNITDRTFTLSIYLSGNKLVEWIETYVWEKWKNILITGCDKWRKKPGKIAQRLNKESIDLASGALVKAQLCLIYLNYLQFYLGRYVASVDSERAQFVINVQTQPSLCCRTNYNVLYLRLSCFISV